MNLNLPADLSQFVNEELASGNYASTEELVGEAVRLLRDLRAKQAAMRAEVQVGIDQADRGLVKSLDLEGLIARCTAKLAEEGIRD